MRVLALVLAVLATASAVEVEFGLARFDQSPGHDWKLMSAKDVNQYKVQFVTAYNENKGIKLVKKFQSGNCCIALKGGHKFTISGSQFGYQFPATGQGQIACNPKGGYSQSVHPCSFLDAFSTGHSHAARAKQSPREPVLLFR